MFKFNIGSTVSFPSHQFTILPATFHFIARILFLNPIRNTESHRFTLPRLFIVALTQQSTTALTQLHCLISRNHQRAQVSCTSRLAHLNMFQVSAVVVGASDGRSFFQPASDVVSLAQELKQLPVVHQAAPPQHRKLSQLSVFALDGHLSRTTRQHKCTATYCQRNWMYVVRELSHPPVSLCPSWYDLGNTAPPLLMSGCVSAHGNV